MFRLHSALLALAFSLSACTFLQRTAHLYSSDAPVEQIFEYRDGGSSVYYTFDIGSNPAPETVLFFYGATGCPSWKSVMPGYVAGLRIEARVFVLNKRFVSDRSSGLFDCGEDFHRANHPDQWVADYSAFIDGQLAKMTPRPRHIVLVGVSEGALPAGRIAASNTAVTHLALLGSGGMTMRQSLTALAKRGAIRFDVEGGWQQISADPRSIDKSWYGNRYHWWSDIMDLDPTPDLLELKIPILLGIGELDSSVPLESAQMLAKRFAAAGKNNLTLRIYPGADHRLNAEGMAYREAYFTELGQWLHSK